MRHQSGMSNALQSVLDRERQLLQGAHEVVYKVVEDGDDLKAWVFFPPEGAPQENRTGVLLFFSSAWDKGRPTQLAPQAMYLAERGAVAVLVDYRTASSHQAGPFEALRDAHSAVRWIRLYADQLGVDPSKIVFAGGSAGAHAGAAAAILRDLPSDETDPADVSPVPNALVLYSPIVEVEKGGYGWDKFESSKEAKELSLFRGIQKGMVPMQIFHGSSDRLLPIQTVERFAQKVKRKKNHCDFHRFDGRDHSFFNLNVDPLGYEAAISETDRFLVDLGYLEPTTEDGESCLESWREQEY